MWGMKQSKQPRKEPDASLIQALGGPSKLAATLGLSQRSSVQRVANWQYRGIPAQVKLERPDLFLPHLKASRRRKPVAESV
jgi:hypothetical protein